MRKFTKPALFTGLLMASFAIQAQVTFTNQGSLLGPITGSPYKDQVIDMNGDHLDDVVRVVSGAVYIDYQQPGGSFLSMNYPVETAYPPNWSIVAADIDGNGYTDMCWGNGTRVTFVYANDTGTGFTAQVMPEYIFSQRSSFFDLDNDGNLDAFVCHDVDTNRPYRNVNGILSYDLSLFPNLLPVGGNYAIVWVDYDNDGDGDLYVTKCRGGAPASDPQRINLLYRNNGDGTFTSVGPEANMDDNNQSWTTVFEDFDNDGDMDAFTVNHSSSDATGGAANKFMQNNGDGTFTNIMASTGIPADDLGAWNLDAADFNNDGFVDILSELSKELFLNNGNGTFTGYDLPFSGGGIGDVNNDGFLDVARGNNMWMNNGNDNNYIKINLEGIISNKNGIGARVEIYGDFGKQIRDVRAGRSFAPGSHLGAHFGIGQSTEITQVVVKWPSGMVTVLENPEINMTHVMYEVGCMLPSSEISAIGNTVLCPGQSVQLTAPAGFTYSWSDGQTAQTITVSEPGNYNAILWNDEECASITNSINVSMYVEGEPSISLTGPNVFCEGETVILTSTIGQDYQWSNGLSGQSITVGESGDYFVNVAALCSGSGMTSNTISLTMMPAAALPVAQDIQIGTPGSVILTATGDNLLWYDAPNAIVPVGSGNSFETPVVSTQSSFWVESQAIYGGELEDGGKLNNEGAGGIPSTGGVLRFNASEDFTLLSVRVYVPETSAAGLRTVEVKDANGIVVHTADFDLQIGEHVLELNFDIVAGDNYTIGCPQNNLFRNSGGVAYPYAIGSVGSIFDSTFGASYYYYFYDWKTQKSSYACASQRVEVTVSVVGVDELSSNVLSVFPNPTSGLIYLENQAGKVTFAKVVNALGEMVWSGAVNKTGITLVDLSGLAAGVYTLQLTEGSTVHNKRLVKN